MWWAAAAERPSLVAVLSAEEQRRVERLQQPGDRARFVTARALARLLLAQHLGQAPADIRIEQTCRLCGSHDHGKPALSDPGPSFAITHAGDWVGVALHPTKAVGLDIEPTAPSFDSDRAGLTAIALTPPERALYDALPREQRATAVLRWWTRKEAVLKATGWGLAVAPDRVHVSAPDQAPALLDWPSAYDLGCADGVTLRDVGPAPGYIGCVAVLGVPAGVIESDGHAVLRASATADAGPLTTLRRSSRPVISPV